MYWRHSVNQLNSKECKQVLNNHMLNKFVLNLLKSITVLKIQLLSLIWVHLQSGIDVFWNTGSFFFIYLYIAPLQNNFYLLMQHCCSSLLNNYSTTDLWFFFSFFLNCFKKGSQVSQFMGSLPFSPIKVPIWAMNIQS